MVINLIEKNKTYKRTRIKLREVLKRKIKVKANRKQESSLL
jgi:hypothetical protein